jgi:cell division septal protein FtsQ
MKTMDHKIAERRHRVTEQRAQTRLRIVIALLGVAALIGAGWWLVRSPLLSIRTVTVTGDDHTAAQATLDRLGIGIGTPTISVDEAAIEAAVLTDPWVAEASVVATWPGTLEIEIVEQVPVAAFQRGDTVVAVSRTGAVIETLDDPGGLALVIGADGVAPRPGDVIGGAAEGAALEFVAALPPDLASSCVVTIDRGLEITVAGHPVRLGRSVDLGAKASALAVVIASGVPEGSIIDVTAPRHPAVAQPSS